MVEGNEDICSECERPFATDNAYISMPMGASPVCSKRQLGHARCLMAIDWKKRALKAENKALHLQKIIDVSKELVEAARDATNDYDASIEVAASEGLLDQEELQESRDLAKNLHSAINKYDYISR